MQSALTQVFLPISLAIIMWGMGLSLVPDDFKRVLVYPKAVFIGLINQFILLPLVGFWLAQVFQLSPPLAVGLMILAASPGGVTSNLFTYLSRGDTALSITLTAASSFLTIFTIPIVVQLSLGHFLNQEQAIQLDVLKTISTIFIITVLPLSLGMLIKKINESFANKMEKPIKIASLIFLLIIIAGAVLKEKENLIEYSSQVGGAVICLNLAMMAVGFVTAKISQLSKQQSITIAIETGIQNGTLSLFVALTLMNNWQMAIAPSIYSLFMFLSGGAMVFAFGRKRQPA